MAEDAFVTDFEHIMADDITENVRFIMYDSESGKTASAGEVSKYMMKNVHVDTTLTEEGAAADAKAVGDALATKADTKGRYEDLIVGGAEQLMADGYETDKETYLFRTTGGSADVGNREYLDKIVGGTVAWNQLVQRLRVGVTINGITITPNEDMTLTVNGTATGNVATPIIDGVFPADIKSHRFLVTESTKVTGGGTNWFFYNGYAQHGRAYEDKGGGIVTHNGTADWTPTLYMYIENGVTVNNVKLKINVFDLTAMFGSTIADYIYSLEQANAGAGVAWFRQYFPNDYYPYDPGTLRSVEGVSAHETVGFNQWDTSTDNVGKVIANNGTLLNNDSYSTSDYIKVVAGATYYFKNVAPNANANTIAEYDADKIFIRTQSISGTSGTNTSGTKAMSDNTHYIRVARFNTSTEPCINLSDPTRNGEYEPYQKHTYPLDSSLTLRGIPKLVDGKLEFDGDVYPPSGEVQRRYGIVDLGTRSWQQNNITVDGNPAKLYRAALPNSALVYNSVACICLKYPTVLSSARKEKTLSIGTSDGSVDIIDSTYDNAVNFKTAMSGVYLVYELATPTTETAEGYEQYQMCDPSGTEEFVTTGIVPVGHETRYPHDLKKKIETAPDSPSTDGTYLMKRSGGKNTYMALPSTPSANGSYVLTVTVSGGTASYSWAAKE